MNLVVETLVTLLLFFYYILEAIVLFCVPFSLRRKDVKGQKVLITGSGSGLGRLMAIKFGKLGCEVILMDVNQKGNEATARDLGQEGVTCHAYTCDLSRRDDVKKVMEQIKRDVGDIDILVNNAGIVSGYKILDCPDELMEKTMAVNVNAHFWTTKSVLPAMLERNRGHIVTIASAAGFCGVTGLVDYCASKFAAVGFDETLRMEIESQGKTGVYTTAICPFYINTGMFDGVTTRFPKLLPILDPDYVVERIMDGVLSNQTTVIIPRILYLVFALKNILPVKAGLVALNFMGANSSMDDFKGRRKQD